MLEVTLFPSSQRKLQGLNDPVDQGILKLENVAECHVRRLGPEQRAVGSFDQLRVHTEMLAIRQDGARENGVQTPAVHEQALQLFRRYSDHKFSIVDCSSFVIARRKRVQEVFGFDLDFVVMGFVLRPS